MDGGGEEDVWDKYGDKHRLSLWEDKVSQVALGTDTNAPLAYAPGLEHHHLIMSTIGYPGGRL